MLATWFWLRHSCEVAGKMWTRAAASSKGSNGVEGPPPRWLTHTSGKLVLAVGKRPQFLIPWASP